jgi:pimeloyl-ACP methyl ester carboxylesterase
MDFDNSWRALFRPGEADRYFDRGGTPAGSIDLDPARDGYSAALAWWLAELSRLVYRRGEGETSPVARGGTRAEILARVGLEEVLFLDRRGTQCAIVRAAAGVGGNGSRGFAALVFRGTEELRDWITDATFFRAQWERGGRVHAGFRGALDQVWKEAAAGLDGLGGGPIYYTGHSLGGALATLAASRRPPRAAYTFGAPRVGDAGFGETLSDLCLYRVVNNSDTVPTLSAPMGRGGFRHVGELRYIGGDGQLLVDPSPDAVRADQARRRRAPEGPEDRRRWFQPPPRLADHAPVNYVARLERLLGDR